MQTLFKLLRYNCTFQATEEIIYQNGKGFFSFAQLTTHSPPPTASNIYFQQQFTKTIEPLPKIYRCILTPQLSAKQMHFDINKLKSSKLLHSLMQLAVANRQTSKENASVILIDGSIKNQYSNELDEESRQNQLHKNILEIEKLFGFGLGLSCAFVMSRHNVQGNTTTSTYLKQIQAKSKGIDTNVVCNQVNFNELVHNMGYKLQHIILRSYSQGLEQENLSKNTMYNLPQLLYMMAYVIEFRGKIILLNNKEYSNNCQYIQELALKVGYLKKNKQDFVGDQNWYSML